MSQLLTIDFPKALVLLFHFSKAVLTFADKFTVVSFLEALEDSVSTQSKDAMDES